MDLIFVIAGLLMTWSLADYLKRDSRLLNRLAYKKPERIYAFIVPFCKAQTLTELRHFVKRNHLSGTYIKRSQKTGIETWLLETNKASGLKYPLYLEQISERDTVIELGAVSLDSVPYLLYRRKHKSTAQLLGSHFEKSWKRKSEVEKLAKI